MQNISMLGVWQDADACPDQFERHLPQLYPLVTIMLERDMSPDLWQAVRLFYVKTGHVKGLIEKSRTRDI